MGIGCGGGYPLSAIIVSEFAPTRTRGRLMTAIFACQAWGQLGTLSDHSRYQFETSHLSAAGAVGIVVVVAYGDAIRAASYPATLPVDYAWRLLVGLGCVPGFFAYYFRFTMPETPRFVMDVERNLTRATHNIKKVLSIRRHTAAEEMFGEEIVMAPRASFADFTAYFSKRNNLKVLIGTAYSWFALDVSAI